MITCCNLLCGAIAVYMATQGAFMIAFGFILLGACFDFFDGMTARKLGVSGPLGIQMDSLADDITFGLAPAMMLTCYLQPVLGWWSGIALLMAAFSAYRLGKFNIDERQTTSFIGLATPANAIFWGGICTMPYAMTYPTWIAWSLLAISLISCYLLVSELPMFSLKMKNLRWADNKFRFIFLIGCLIIIAFCVARAVQYSELGFAFFAGTGCIIWYVTINLINSISHEKNHNPRCPSDC